MEVTSTAIPTSAGIDIFGSFTDRGPLRSTNIRTSMITASTATRTG